MTDAILEFAIKLADLGSWGPLRIDLSEHDNWLLAGELAEVGPGPVFELEGRIFHGPTGEIMVGPGLDRQEACYGREQGGLELQRVMLDKEMLRDCDERAAEEIVRLRKELEHERQRLWIESQLLRGQRGLGDPVYAGIANPPDYWSEARALGRLMDAPRIAQEIEVNGVPFRALGDAD